MMTEIRDIIAADIDCIEEIVHSDDLEREIKVLKGVLEYVLEDLRRVMELLGEANK